MVAVVALLKPRSTTLDATDDALGKALQYLDLAYPYRVLLDFGL